MDTAGPTVEGDGASAGESDSPGGLDAKTNPSQMAHGGASELDYGAYVSVALMVLLGSFTAAAAKVAVRDLPVAIVPIIRFGVAGLCLIPLVWGKGTFQRLWRENGVLLLIAAALFVPINQSFFLNATRHAPTTHVAIFYATAPLFVLLLACVLGHERFHRGRLLGMLASIAGVAVIALGNLWGGSATPNPRAAGTGSILWGDLLLIGAVASWGGYLTLSKPLVARHGAVPVLVGTFLLGTLLDIPVALATHSGWAGVSSVSTASWIALGLLALVITPMGQIFQNVSLRRLEASQVATISNGSPVLTLVWGVWFFEEAITVTLAIGGLLTLLGIVWSSRNDARATAKSTPNPLEADREAVSKLRFSPGFLSRENLGNLMASRACDTA